MSKAIDKLNVDIVKIATMTKKEELQTAMSIYGLEFTDEMGVNELKGTLIKHIQNEIASLELKENLTDDATLAVQAEQIITKATELNEAMEQMSQEERDAFVIAMQEQTPALAEEFEKHFPHFRSAKAYTRAVQPASDLPMSEIITGLPLRVVEQSIISQVESYSLSGLIPVEFVRNGIKEVFYNDFNETDTESGFADVKLADFNPALSPVFKDTYKVDTEIHKALPILDSVLNDIMLNPSGFVALINSVVWGLTKPVSNRIYKEFIKYIEDDTNADEVAPLTGADAKEKAKEMHLKLIKLGQTSRGHLKATFGSKKLEHRLPSSRATIILNSKYATDYKYDLTANTFQLGEITLPVKSILVVDFEDLKEFTADASATKIADIEYLIWEDGNFNMIFHYQATKVMNTTRMKSVIHQYTRFGVFKRKNRYLGKFTKKTA